MYDIITCKYEKDPIKNNPGKAATLFFKLYHYLLPWKLVVGSGLILNSYRHVLIAGQYEKDQMKNSGENVMTSFSPL